MRVTTVHWFNTLKAALPYLWGFAAAAALDYVVDVQTLFLPIMAAVGTVSAGLLILRKNGR